jgi:hypothetical protein
MCGCGCRWSRTIRAWRTCCAAACRDDGGFQVEVQHADGSIAEVRLDAERRILGVEDGD